MINVFLIIIIIIIIFYRPKEPGWLMTVMSQDRMHVIIEIYY